MKNQRIKNTLFGDKKKLIHFVAGEALSQGQVQISWQAQHFRKVGAMLSQVRYRFRGRRSIFARAVQISRQAPHFRKVRYRFRGGRNTVGRSGTDFAAGAAL